MAFFDFLKGKNKKDLSASERREKSIEILKSQGVPFMEQLPLRYEVDEVTPREKDEIVARALCAFATIMCACSLRDGNLSDDDMANAKNFLDNRYGSINTLTPKERKILDGEADRQEAVNMVWKYESLWSLLWAMGLVDKLKFPDDICDCEAVMAVFGGDFTDRITLRSTAEILDALDLTYRYHWACVNARVNGTKDAGLNESVVMERRAGLEWLCCKGQENDDLSEQYNAWDYPDMNT